MKVRIELTEEVTEIYEVEYDGDIQDFDPTDYMAREYLVSSLHRKKYGILKDK